MYLFLKLFSYITKHLISAPSGNSEFCFPSTLNVSLESRENKTHYFPREQTLGVYYSRLDEKALIDEVQFVNWNTVFASTSDPTSMFDKFYSEISEIVDRHIPIKQLSRKELKFRSKPWITPAQRQILCIIIPNLNIIEIE